MNYNEAMEIAQRAIGEYRSISSMATEVVNVKQIEDNVFEATIKYNVIDGNSIVASYNRKVIIAKPTIIK